jgi:hypothetical protein
MADTTDTRDTREANMRELAEKLEFEVDKTNSGFTLTPTTDPERAANLSLAQAE